MSGALKLRALSRVRIPTPPAPPTLTLANDLARPSVAVLGGLEYDSLKGASLGLCGFFFSIPRCCGRFEGVNETGRYLRYIIDSSQERSLIGPRRFAKTADFSHELERGSLNLCCGDGRIKVEKCLDVPAHFYTSTKLDWTLVRPLLTAEARPLLSLTATLIRSYLLLADLAVLEEARRWRA